MSPPLIMDEKYAAMGMDIIEEAIAEVEQEFGYTFSMLQRDLKSTAQ
jgi:hypothetical protein